MACKSSYELHHHFPKLAEESGFSFNVHRPRSHIDWNKIRLIDIESIVKDRKFILIEQHLNDLLHCVLESEFDVRILDEGFLKMFRLAQLTVEYQQFCRHYLDRSVYVLREEINSLVQELDANKSSLRDKEEELRKLRRKTKQTYRTPLPYGNDNIATMILKTLANKGDIFPSTSNADPLQLQYNKCNYCDKIFLNQLYLKSHLSRRHGMSMEIPQKDSPDNIQNTSTEKDSKLNDEILELKTKLKEMENLLIQVNQKQAAIPPEPKSEVVIQEVTNENMETKMKDVEVSTNLEYNVIDKIEEWKKEEHEKYNSEINLLRTQIAELINSFKTKDEEKHVQNYHSLIEQLHTTIKQQGVEINLLKQELNHARLLTQNEELERKKDTETQITAWAKRVEAQNKKYEALLQQLNDVALEAKEARAQAEEERMRSAKLQIMLEESMRSKKTELEEKSDENIIPIIQSPKINGDVKKKMMKSKTPKLKQVANHQTLENLHRKAQELLNIESTSSSDISSASVEKNGPFHLSAPKAEFKSKHENDNKEIKKDNVAHRRNKATNKDAAISTKRLQKNNFDEAPEPTDRKTKKEKSKPHLNILPTKVGNGTAIVPGSPMKLVRAKITEEVNSRLVTIGVDPLKSTLPKKYFQKQKMHLQRQHESKAKKNPDYQKVKHTILAYLDSNTSRKSNEIMDTQDYISPNKISKAFSITSVISNVKSKALSLVKSNDTSVKSRRKEISTEVAKKAMSLLKTPPDSMTTSPAKPKLSVVEDKTPHLSRKKLLGTNATVKKERPQIAKQHMRTYLDNTNDDSSESDHKYYNSTIVQQSAKSIENLIKSPVRRPASANADYKSSVKKIVVNNVDNLSRSQSAANILDYKVEPNNLTLPKLDNSSEDIESHEETNLKKTGSEGNVPKQTKGVLKNASSTSSLNKKKVLFDMDAIQMKSVSASPSQSITDKSENNGKFELGLINLDGEEWDISSIENEPLKNDTKIQVISRTSPKIAELKQTIESQLARRNETPSTVRVGGVDLMPAPMIRTSSIAGSNTSLGSSILDESDGSPSINHKAFIKPKKVTDNKEDSEIDISEYSLDGMGDTNKKGNDSF